MGKARPMWPLLAAAVAAALSACGDGRAKTERPPLLPVPRGFPKAEGRTLAALRAGLGPGPRFVTSVSVLEPGRNRVGFALFDRERRQIGDTPAALYAAKADGTDLRGPFKARYFSLEAAPRFRSKTTTEDTDAARSIYVASVAFPEPGEYRLLGVAELDGRPVGARPAATVSVGRASRPIAVGERAPRVHTPTRASVKGDWALIETRVPPDSMHEVDLASVIGRRPVMLLFATPGLCPSRICGPVVDIVEQLKSGHSRDAAFIHVEIYNRNKPEEGQRPAVRAYGLPSEPWLFAIDRSGRVAARIEGAFSLDEAQRALEAAVHG